MREIHVISHSHSTSAGRRTVGALTLVDYEVSDPTYGAEIEVVGDGNSSILELLQSDAPWELLAAHALNDPPDNNELGFAHVPESGASVRFLVTVRAACDEPTES